MTSKWNEMIPEDEISKGITKKTVEFAEKFGTYLAKPNLTSEGRNDRGTELTTSQLRRFFGEVKRQQAKGYDASDFILLKPKLAYAVGRAQKKNGKIKDFFNVLSDAIDKVENEADFNRFIKIFEAIVAFHRSAEGNN